MGGLKTERALRDALSRRLTRTFADDVCGVEAAWPWTLHVGRPSSRELVRSLEELDVLIRALRSWEARTDVEVVYETRDAGGPKRVPCRVEIPTADVAAMLATSRKDSAARGTQAQTKDSWTKTLERARTRRDLIWAALPHVDSVACARTVRATDLWDDLQFELLLSAATWFFDHDATGLTPRQVPLPGIDAKWLDTARNRQLVCLLSNKEELGLIDRPARLEFAYLDPEHAARGRRHFDSWMANDACELAYRPRVCIIVENKDTYLSFPPLEGGLCVFGAGKAGMALAATFAGVRDANEVLYWGDIDADGFEILHGYRERGVPCRSILMDNNTYERFERYGTSLEKDHRTRIERERKDLPLLTEAERTAYELVTSPRCAGHRRIEQEKIPLGEALHALGEALIALGQ